MSATDRGLSGWQGVAELLDAGRPLADAAEADARGLLTLSSRSLAPLDDPLSTDFRRHRWLRFNREEAYSDWFAWILDELNSVRAVSEILGIDITGALGDRFTVEREVEVPFGHDGRRGRLDILLKCPRVAMVIVEVKVTAADDSDVVKHRGYGRWLDLQTDFARDRRRAVIISNSATAREYEGFAHCGWDEVCIRLRQMAPKLIADGRGSLVALMLCFVGAVEETLLGLEPITDRRGHSVSRAGCINTRDYLDRTMGGSVQETGTGSTELQERFMDTGIRCYPQAMFALSDFRSMVLESAKTVLEGKLAALGTALGSPLNPSSVEDHINPNDLGQSDGRCAWVANRIDLPTVGTGYFGLIWGGPSQTDPEDCRVVAMILPRRERREEILQCAGALSQPVERWSGSELSLTAVVNSECSFFDSTGGPSVFERELVELIDRWCRILSKVPKYTT